MVGSVDLDPWLVADTALSGVCRNELAGLVSREAKIHVDGRHRPELPFWVSCGPE